MFDLTSPTMNNSIQLSNGITALVSAPNGGSTFLLGTIAQQWTESNKSVLLITTKVKHLKFYAQLFHSGKVDELNNEEVFLNGYQSKFDLNIPKEVKLTSDCIEAIISQIENNGKPDIILIDNFHDIRSSFIDNYSDQSYYDLIQRLSILQRALQIPIVITGQILKKDIIKNEYDYPKPEHLNKYHIAKCFVDSYITIYRPSFYKEDNPNMINIPIEDRVYFFNKDRYVTDREVSFDYPSMSMSFGEFSPEF